MHKTSPLVLLGIFAVLALGSVIYYKSGLMPNSTSASTQNPFYNPFSFSHISETDLNPDTSRIRLALLVGKARNTLQCMTFTQCHTACEKEKAKCTAFVHTYRLRPSE